VCGSTWTRLAEDLFLWSDSCNVYLLRNGAHAVVIDAGTGAWASHIDELGVRQIDGIVLTHTDRDQCCGMYRDTAPPAVASARLVVPSGDAAILQPDRLAKFWREYSVSWLSRQFCRGSRTQPSVAIAKSASGRHASVLLPHRVTAVAP
jgi:glyoxylase-like metal-dependent hydrolase (beta-lactamase superfamily II)